MKCLEPVKEGTNKSSRAIDGLYNKRRFPLSCYVSALLFAPSIVHLAVKREAGSRICDE